jgi:hypothetical protein
VAPSLEGVAQILFDEYIDTIPNATVEDYLNAVELAVQKNLTRNDMAAELNAAMEEGEQVAPTESEMSMDIATEEAEKAGADKEFEAVTTQLEKLPTSELEKLAESDEEFNKWEEQNDIVIRKDLEGDVFQLVGENAILNKDVVDNLSVAREMESKKHSSKDVFLATGWERGKDNKWRYELPDIEIKDNAKIKSKLKINKGDKALFEFRGIGISNPFIDAEYGDAVDNPIKYWSQKGIDINVVKNAIKEFNSDKDEYIDVNEAMLTDVVTAKELFYAYPSSSF